MLILSRRMNEKIVFMVAGLEVKLTFLEIRKSGSLKIGIDAPQEVKILREELTDGKQK
jgi:carbon storage regulator CsrA